LQPLGRPVLLHRYRGFTWNIPESDLAALVARVRRAMPRNADVMALCDELRRRRVTVKERATCDITGKCDVTLPEVFGRAADEP
jgi:hypothetical protein